MSKVYILYLFILLSFSITNGKFLQKQNRRIMQNSQNSTQSENYTKSVFDTFAIMQGEKEFDSIVWDALFKCMKTETEVDLLNISNKAWEGLLAYGQSNVTSDPWGVRFEWKENNITKLPQGLLPNIDKVVISEPCATVSNIAFLRTILPICSIDLSKWSIPLEYVSAFKSVFVMESVSSSFLHASGTHLGQNMDELGEDLFSWTMHQASVSSLPYDSIIYDFQSTKLLNNSLVMVKTVANMMVSDSVFDWLSTINTFKIPEIHKNIGGILATVFMLTLKDEDAKYIFIEIGQLLLSQDVLNFFINNYMPTLRKVLDKQSIKPNSLTKIILAKKCIGTLIKLLYGILFQESFIKSDFFQKPIVTQLGNILMPFINLFSNLVSGYGHFSEYYDIMQQLSINVYPGRYKCGGHNFSHFIWHEQMGNGLVDLFYLVDDVDRVMKGQNLY